MTNIAPLPASALYRSCDPADLPFEHTGELDGDTGILGQDRAVAAVRFAIGMQSDGYNLFALGPTGIGKFTAVQRFLRQSAGEMPTPDDWCYVHNFEVNHQPRTLRLSPGRGPELAHDMKHLIDELFAVLNTAFESEEYQAHMQAIAEEVQQKHEESLESLKSTAEERGIALLRTPSGLAFAPLREGKVMSPEEFHQLPETTREQVQREVAELQKELQRIIRQIPQLTRETRERARQLKEENASFALAPGGEELREKYRAFPDVRRHLDAVRADIIENIDRLVPGSQAPPGLGGQAPGPTGPDGDDASPAGNPFYNRYRVNVLVDRSAIQGAPVNYEDHPTYANLIGRIEHMSQMGALVTDFTLIKPGSLHQANGGFLILDARKLLQQPYAWEGLKRALQSRELRLESLGQNLGLISTVSLEPGPIPLDLKVVLLGERLLYVLLIQYDPDFAELFKVAADFEDDMARDDDNSLAYARLIASLVSKNDLRHFDAGAVARVIEFSSRAAGDADKLTTHMGAVADLLREASYWAGEAGRERVGAADVQQAIDAQRYRLGRPRERMQEAILQETVLIDTEGEAIGQINGLAVYQVGNHAFGRPNRITARVRLGKGEVIDIERQVEMGGPIHSKGVLIMAGFLAGRFATEHPLTLSASLVFEQSYSGVEGDSASSAELYALLSALAEAPLRQSLAVTGSVNQLGQIQAIGGVNEKIEGFFDICQARGLTGAQGVLIPAANVRHLMLRQDVVEAVAAGQFHVYAVTTVDEGIEILTGVPAGEPQPDGAFPEGSINQRVATRLAALAEKMRALSRPEAEE